MEAKNFGIFVGENQGAITNCVSSLNVIESQRKSTKMESVGSIVGTNKNGGKIENCSSKTNSIYLYSGRKIGGIVGSQISSFLHNCKSFKVKNKKKNLIFSFFLKKKKFNLFFFFKKKKIRRRFFFLPEPKKTISLAVFLEPILEV